jgi:hypothetical protein
VKASHPRAAIVAIALFAMPACFSSGAELSDSGKGLPEVTVNFSTTAEPGSVHTARLSVSNPGPGDISSIVVAFARVGAPAAEGLPNPLVDPGETADSGAVVDVRPHPASASADVQYRFGPLQEGDSTTILFDVEVPEDPGPAANSVTVYDAADPGRARGVRLETSVER